MNNSAPSVSSRRMGNPKFAALQARIDSGHGLIAREWDWWHATFKFLDPEDYAAFMANVRQERIIGDAMKYLTAEDLRRILAKKESES